MRLGLLLALIVTFVLAIVWLSAGWWVTAVADQVFAVNVPAPPITNIAYDGEGFRIGGLSLTFGAPDNQRSDIELQTNAFREVVLTSGGQSFVLGPRTNAVDPSGRPDIALIPDRGDEVSLTATRSFLGWPTPFEFNFLIRTPSWKRYVYYRLEWRKRSGAVLNIHWRYEQDYFSGGGWTAPAMMWNFDTGLLGVAIAGASRVTPD
ncbi:MAG TPA: hypothetical protein VHU18_12065 [Rhizomicrobium sp.]|jgi:hypothetical protein|nr:hypothetical protein [Rhizomicrobium sp.]